jgi:hypothetical protein
MNILKHSERIESVGYSLEFEYTLSPGAGFGFPCTKDGTVNESKLHPDALRNYKACLSGTVRDRPVTCKGVRTERHHYVSPAIGQCGCGFKMELGSFTNECPRCGALYNWAGQALSDPEFWGEETGEHPSECW